MELYYYRDAAGNFGDDLNARLWKHLLPGLFENGNSEVLFLGIGTILDDKVSESPRYAVFGSGAGYGNLPPIDERWKFYCVRGPRTAELLGLDADYAIADPGILASRLPLPAKAKRKSYKISFMPHHVTARNSPWRFCCALAGIHYIDPRSDVDTVMSDIRNSEMLMTGAMHGAVVADSLRVPWTPVRFYDHILEFKWNDWCESMGLIYNPVTLSRIETIAPDLKSKFGAKLLPFRIAGKLRRMASEVEPFLSSDTAMERATSRLLERLENVKRDHADGLLNTR